jgi:hypothetical protein
MNWSRRSEICNDADLDFRRVFADVKISRLIDQLPGPKADLTLFWECLYSVFSVGAFQAN